MITIQNIRSLKPSTPWDVRVDRKSILGNPYRMNSVNDRNRVCDDYDKWFSEQLKRFELELIRLYDIWKRHERLNLFCWCAPKRCHAETIKKWLEEYKI